MNSYSEIYSKLSGLAETGRRVLNFMERDAAPRDSIDAAGRSAHFTYAFSTEISVNWTLSTFRQLRDASRDEYVHVADRIINENSRIKKASLKHTMPVWPRSAFRLLCS